MIAKSYITENLKRLNVAYGKAKDLKQSSMFAKLAVIELCGWIEMSIDDLVIRCAKRNITLAGNFKHIETVLKKNSGFSYEQHIRGLFIQIIGISGVEELEQRLDPAVFPVLTATLRDLIGSRNSLAHTYLKGTTTAIDAPSVTQARFTQVYKGIIEIERVLMSL